MFHFNFQWFHFSFQNGSSPGEGGIKGEEGQEKKFFKKRAEEIIREKLRIERKLREI